MYFTHFSPDGHHFSQSTITCDQESQPEILSCDHNCSHTPKRIKRSATLLIHFLHILQIERTWNKIYTES